MLSLWLSAAPVALADPIDDYNTALAFYKQQRWDQAEAELTKFLAANPSHDRTAAARLYLGQSLVHQKKFEPAREAFRLFADSHKEHPDLYLALYRIGECSYFVGDFTNAKKELDRFVSAYPTHELAEWALQYLGESQLRLNDPKAAAATLQLQLDRFPDGRLSGDARFLLARAQLAAGDRAKALTAFQTIAADNAAPRAPDALLETAMLLYDDKQFAEASAAFDALRQRFPESPLVPLADLNGGYAAYHLGKFDDAIERFDRAAAEPKQADEARFWKGMSLKSKQDYAAAAETFEAIAGSSGNAALASKARFHRADALLRQKDYAAAREQFVAVVDQAPQGPLAADALHLATEAALLAGELDAAEQLDGRFRKDHATSGLALLQRVLHARISLARGDQAHEAQQAADAKRQYEQAAQEIAAVVKGSQVPRTATLARVLLARVQDRLEQFAEVAQTLTPVVEQLRQQPDAEFAEALVLQGRALLKLNRDQEAAEASQTFVDRFPGHALSRDALANLAVAEARLQRTAQSDAALDQLWKDDADRTLAQRTTYELADQAYVKKNWERAAQLFQRLIDAGPGEYQGAALSGLGYSLHEAGRHAQAAEAFASLIRRTGSDRAMLSDAHQMRAISLARAGQPAEAEQAYAAAVKEFAFPADARDLSDKDRQVAANVQQMARSLARLRRDAGEVPAADQAYQVAFEQLRLLPEDKQADLDQLLNEWALLHYEAKDYERSDKLFSQLIALRPSSPLADNARLYLAESAFFAGRIDEARAAFVKLEADPQAEDLVKHRSLVLLLDIAADKEDWPEVSRLASALTTKFPESDQRPYAQYRLGQAQLQTGAADKAAQSLAALHDSQEPAVRGAEWFPSVRLLLARAYLETKNYAGVDKVLQAFRTEDPQSPYLYQADDILGRRFKNEAKWDQAREAFQRVIDSESGRRTETAANAQLMIAETYLLEDKFDDALSAYYKVYANYKFPDVQAPALFQAAQCDEKLGRWPGAVKTYELLIAEFPNNPYARQAGPKLEAARTRAAAASTPSVDPTAALPEDASRREQRQARRQAAKGNMNPGPK